MVIDAQNYAAAQGFSVWQDAVDAWAAEGSQYDYNTATFSATTGHFTCALSPDASSFAPRRLCDSYGPACCGARCIAPGSAASPMLACRAKFKHVVPSQSGFVGILLNMHTIWQNLA